MPKAIFNGADASNATHFWETDGTAIGTVEMPSLPTPEPIFSSFGAPGAASLGTAAVYGSSTGELCITDGTAAHTFTVLSHGPSTTANLFPTSFAVLGNKAYFSGVDQIFLGSAASGLWATDGTAAGTVEIVHSNPENTGSLGRSGLSPRHLTVFTNKLAFIGRVSSFGDSIYVTDGTTTSILLVAGPSDLAGFGNKFLYSTFNTLGVSDGTFPGTATFTVNGAGPDGIRATDLTSFGNEVLFNGQDAASHFGLWVSDGTTGGTSELSVSGAYANGLNPQNITTFGPNALFQGQNAAGYLGLWITDGTGAGTHEIGVAGAYALGVKPTNLQLFDNRVLFNGLDAGGHQQLWLTDGTSAGTHQISPGGASASGLQPNNIGVVLDGFHWVADWDFTWHVIASGDFNHDGNTDVVWDNGNGVLGGWLMAQNPVAGSQISGTLALPPFPGWHTVATGDFNKDGNTDILWQNADGLVGEWFMGNGTRQGTATIQNMAGWHVITSGDFNHDGITDVIWDNGAGVQGGWLMNAIGQIGGTLQLPFFPGWTAVATGDFNHDGNTDIMWRNADGLIAEWLMGDGTRQGTMTLQNMAGWNAIANGDFNGDGTDDVLWRNADGVTAVWFMQNAQIFSTKSYVSTAGQNVVTAGDFNHDGVSDVMWQNTVTGEITTWQFNNGGLLI